MILPKEKIRPSNALVAGDDPIEVLDAVLPGVMTVHASDRYLLPGVTIEELHQEDGTMGYPKKLVHGVTGGAQVIMMLFSPDYRRAALTDGFQLKMV